MRFSNQTIINYQFMRVLFLLIGGIVTFHSAFSQKYDSVIYTTPDSTKTQKAQCYTYQGITYCYGKPKPFSFIWQVPKTLGTSLKITFRKKSLPAITAITLSSFLLIAYDQDITNATQHLGHYIGMNSDIQYTNVVGFHLGKKYVPVYQAPQNINTALYSVGEGFTSVALSGGLFIYGKIKHDYRSVQTASQLIQSQIVVGLFAQTVKRISGRESPRVSTRWGGAWRTTPSFREYARHTSRYDAFPSGHLATMMATVTILTSNYPEKKWLKPVGYGVIGLVGLAMVNNGVHWAGDYPLALGIGYISAKATVSLNRWINPPR